MEEFFKVYRKTSSLNTAASSAVKEQTLSRLAWETA